MVAVQIYHTHHCVSRSPVPAGLQATREARSLLSSRYTKAFTYGTYARYIWTNFALDTIHADLLDLFKFTPEIPLIRRLRVAVCDDQYHLDSNQFELLYKLDVVLVALESLTIHVDGPFRDDWWGWLNVFEPMKEKVEGGTVWTKLVELRIVDRDEDEISLSNFQALKEECN